MDITVNNEQIDDIMSNFLPEFTFGWRLRHIRNKRGITQKQLGIICNFPQNAADVRIRQYESDKRHPKEEIINLLANELKISPVMLSMQTTSIQVLLFLTILWSDIANIIEVFDSTKEFVPDDIVIYPIDIQYDSTMPGIVPKGDGPFYDWLRNLSIMRKRYKNRDISLEEYRNWEYLWEPSYNIKLY